MSATFAKTSCTNENVATVVSDLCNKCLMCSRVTIIVEVAEMLQCGVSV